jgi:hypothetical protein
MTTQYKEINKYLDALQQTFKTSPNKHEAHYRSRPILQEMAVDPAFLTAILTQHLRKPGILNATHYPVVALEIELNPYYGLVANCWIPLPGRETDIATKAIHHHGDMLLTTVTAFGPGYEHWTFERPEKVDEDNELFSMKVIDHEAHPLSHVAFVDSYVAHLPFFPPALTITLALWSSKFPVTWKDHLKRMPPLRGNEEKLRNVAARLKLAKALELKLVEYFDYYPTCEGFKGMKERREFEYGPNENYLYSLFHVIQQTGNEKLAAVIGQQLHTDEIQNIHTVEKLNDDLQSGRSIEGRLSEGHFGLYYANFTKKQLMDALAQQQHQVREKQVAASEGAAV